MSIRFISGRSRTLVGMLILSILVMLGATAGLANQYTSLEIIKKAETASTPQSVHATLAMILINDQGKEKVRKLESWKRGDDYSVMVFKKPKSVAGTAMLKAPVTGGDEATWLYLPSLDLTKRISQESENRQFMGSDFTYDDLGSRNINEYRYELIRVNHSEQNTIYVVKGTAKNPQQTGYSKVKSWISNKYWKPIKVKYYDLQGKLLKIRTNSEFEKQQGFWIVKQMTMKNVQTGHKTILSWNNYKIDVNLPENIFQPEALPTLLGDKVHD